MDYNRETIRFNVLRNALYHTSRRRIFERWNRWLNLTIILLGTAAASDALKAFGIPQLWIGFAIAAVGSAQLVFDFGRSARDHQSLQRDYYKLLADIEFAPNPDQEKYGAWQSEMIRITADEPPVLRAIDAKSYNDAMDALDTFDGNNERLVIPFMHRLFGGIFHFDGHRYQKLSEAQPKMA